MYLRNKLFTTFDKVVRSISYNHCCHCSSSSSSSNKQQQSESPLKQLLNDSASFQDATPTSEQQQWSTLPYTGSTRIRKQGEYFTKEKKDPRDSSIILFPGQGSQFVGMGRDLLKYPVAKDLYELANYVLGYDLLKLCLEGPIEKLNETKYSQPAILVASLAALEKLKEERPNAIDNCVAAAGFSLGEITALIFSGAIGFERGLQLVKIRAEAMQLASALHKGGMATVMYGPSTNIKYALIKAKEWALKMGVETSVCDVANYLFPHCKVIAGNEEALQYLEKNMSELKIRKIKRLPVSGAFHTDLMAEAMVPFRAALNKTEISEPAIRVYANLDGKSYKNAEQIRKTLPKQIVKPVKWEQLLHVAYERDVGEYFPQTYECGPGRSLKTILKQVNAKAWDHCITINA